MTVARRFIRQIDAILVWRLELDEPRTFGCSAGVGLAMAKGPKPTQNRFSLTAESRRKEEQPFIDFSHPALRKWLCFLTTYDPEHRLLP